MCQNAFPARKTAATRPRALHPVPLLLTPHPAAARPDLQIRRSSPEHPDESQDSPAPARRLERFRSTPASWEFPRPAAAPVDEAAPPCSWFDRGKLPAESFWASAPIRAAGHLLGLASKSS